MLAWFGFVGPSMGAALLRDTFTYPNGSLVGAAGSPWQTHSGTAGQVDVVSGAVHLTEAESEDVNAVLAGGPYTNGFLHAGFTLRLNSLPSGLGNYFAHFKDDGTFNFRARVYVTTNSAASGAYRLGMASLSASATNAAYLPRDLFPGATYRLVVSYYAGTGVSILSVNPNMELDGTNMVLATDSFVGSGTNITRFALRQSLAVGVGMGDLTVDDLIVSTNFMEALPPAPEAISREVSVFNFSSPSAPVEAISREMSVFNFSSPSAQVEAVSREVSVFNFSSPSAPVEAVSREVSVFNFSSPSAPIEAISREVSILMTTNPLPDIAATKLGLLQNALPPIAGTPYSLAYTMTNLGNADAVPIWTNRFMLATSSNGDNAVTLWETAITNVIAAGASLTLTQFFTLSSNIVDTWYLGVNLDSGNNLVETNKANNIAFTNIFVLSAPFITAQPTSQAPNAGTTATFSAGVGGSPTLLYQWQFNGTNLNDSAHVVGSHSNVLSILATTLLDAGNYRLIASNGLGAVTSAVAALTVGGYVTARPTPSGAGPNPDGSYNEFTSSGGTILLGDSTALSPVADAPSRSGSRAYLASSNLTDTNAGFSLHPSLGIAGAIYLLETSFSAAAPNINTNALFSVRSTNSVLSVNSTDRFRSNYGNSTWQTIGYVTNNPGVTSPWIDFRYQSGLVNALLNQRLNLDVFRFSFVAGSPVPVIATQPQSQTNLIRNNASFTVTAGGTQPMYYQWQFNGINLTNGARIAGAQGTTLTVSNLAPTDAGNYQVIVTNAYGSVTSAVAALTVTNLANDFCSGAIPLISGQTNVLNVFSATEIGDPGLDCYGCCSAGFSHGVWYTVTTPTNNVRVNISTCGSDFDTSMEVYTGVCGSLTNVACTQRSNPFGCGNNSAGVSISAMANTTYHVLVGGYGTASGTLKIVANVVSPPANDICATATPLVSGVTNVVNTFNATEIGDPGLDCYGCCSAGFSHGVWYTVTTPTNNVRVNISTCGSDFDTSMEVYTGTCGSLTNFACTQRSNPFGCGNNAAGVSISGAANTTYYVLVGGYGASAGNLQIVANLVAPPTNDICATATPLVSGVTNIVNTSSATEIGDPGLDCYGCCSAGFGRGIWYSVTTPTNGVRVNISTCGSDFDTSMEVYTGTCGALTNFACTQRSNPFGCGNNAAGVSFTAPANFTYYVLVGGYGGSGGNLRIVADLSAAPTNDICSGAITMTSGLTYTQNVFYATEAGDPTSGSAAGLYRGVWYTFTTTKNQRVNVNTCGSDFNTKMIVYTNTCGALGELTANDDNGPYCSSCCGNPASLSFSSASNQTYYILVGSSAATLTVPTSTLRIVADVQDPLPNDTCSGAIAMTAGQLYTVTNIFYATEIGDPASGSAAGLYRGIWYTFTTTKNQRVNLNTCASDFNTKLVVFTNACGALGELTANDDNGPYCSSCCGNPASLSFSSASNQTYYILVGSPAPTLTAPTSTLRIVADVQDPLPNDTCSGAIAMTAGQLYTVTNIFYATEIGDPTNGSAAGLYRGVWYTFTTTKNQRVNVNTCASDFNTKLVVFTNACGALGELTANDDNGPYCSSCCGNPASLSFSSASNQTYYILVGSPAPTFTAPTSTLRIVADVQDPLPNDTCSGAIAMTAGQLYTVTNIFYATEIGDPTSGSAAGLYRGVWYTFTTTKNQRVNVNTCGSDFNTKLIVYTNTCGALGELTANDDNGPYCSSCCGNPASLSFSSASNLTYYILVGSPAPTFTAPTSTLRIVADVQDPPSNDTCAGAIALVNGVTNTINNCFYATEVGDPATNCAGNIFRGVWFTISAATNQQVNLNTCGSDFNTRLAVYTGSCGALTEFLCNDDNGPFCSSCCGNPASASFLSPGNYTYYVLVGSSGPTIAASTGTLRIEGNVQGPPFIVTQPASQIKAPGSTATFTAVAAGSAPLTYQWRYNSSNLTNNGRISGAQSSSLTLSNVQSGDQGGYQVQVTNSAGSALSTVATLLIPSAVYDAASAFSSNANPVGVWSYGFSQQLTNTFVLYKEKLRDQGMDVWRTNIAQGAPFVMHNTSNGVAAYGTARLAAGGLGLHPGPSGQYSTLRFSAPAAGPYLLSATFSGADVDSTTTDVHILSNGVPVMDGLIFGFGPGTGPSYSGTIYLDSGASLDFAVGDGGNGFAFDSTALDAQVAYAAIASPYIVTQPASQPVPLNGAASLTVNAGGTPPLYYQWTHAGTNLPGATNSVLSLSVVQPPQAGSYAVGVSNAFGATNSAFAVLTITQTLAVVTFSNLNQTYNGSGRSVGVTTVPPGLAYTLTYNGSASPPVNAGSYTVVAIVNDANYVGNATNTLVVARAPVTLLLTNLTQSYNGTPRPVSVVTVPPGLPLDITYDFDYPAPTDVGSYQVLIAVTDPNYDGAASDYLTINRANASHTANNATRAFGQPNPVFTGVSVGFVPADNITFNYNCAAVSNSPAGSYPIIVSLNDPNGRLGNYTPTLNHGTLTVLPRTPTLTWANPAPIIYGTALGSNQLNASASVAGSFAYSPAAGEVLDVGNIALLAAFTPADQTNYSGASISATIPVLPATLSVTVSNATRYEGQTNPVFAGTVTGITNGDTITVTFGTVADESSPAGSYSIIPVFQDPANRLLNYTVTTNTGTLTVFAGNDMFANRKVLGSVSNVIFSSNLNATKEAGEPNHAGNAGGHSLWWSWTAPAQGFVTLNTVGSSFETLLAVYTGTSVSNLTLVATNTGGGGNHTSLLNFLANNSVTYQIAVDGFAEGTNIASGNIVMSLIEDFGSPQFVTQPQGQTVPVGTSVNFSASVRGSQPAFYQWRKNGQTIPGATQAQLFTNTLYSIASAQTNDSGTYTVMVSNLFNTAVSTGAVLTVFARPDNDDYANAFVVTGVSNRATGNNTYATPDCSGAGCFEAALFAGRSVWWSWTAPTNGTVVVDTIGSAFDTVLALYTNAAPGSNILVAVDDESGGNHASRLQFDTRAGVTYHFGVDGSRWASPSSAFGAVTLNLRVLYVPPQITLQPVSQNAELGWSVSFSSAATGTTPLAYQWLKNGSPVAGATGANYAIASVQAGDPGAYSLIASNAFGTSTSSNATLTLYSAPANDNFANRFTIPGLLTNTVTGINVGATREAGEPSHAGNSGGRSIWWKWTAPTNGTVFLDTIGSSFDTLLAVYTGSAVGGLTLVASDDNSGGFLNSRLVFNGVAGTTYQIAMDGYNPTGTHGAAFGNITLNLAQSARFAPVVLTQPQSQAAAAGGTVNFSITAVGLPSPTYQWVYNGTPLAGKTNTTLTLKNVTTNQAGAYSVLLSNAAGVTFSDIAQLRVEKAINPGFRGDWPGFETGDALDVALSGGLAYVATSAGFLILDVGDPVSPRRIGGYHTDSPATRIAVQNGFVYTLTSSNQLGHARLSRFDARNPGLPRKVAEFVSNNANDFDVSEDMICAVDGSSLLVLNTNCAVVGSVNTGNGLARRVVVSNATAYVTWPNLVGVYNVADPAHPTASPALAQSQAELALNGGYLYALTGGQRVVQLRLLDPTNPGRPQVGLSSLSNVLGHADSQAIAVSSNAVFVVTAGFDGNALGVYTPLGDPWNPALVATNLFAEGTPRRAATDGTYLYVANGGAGLKIFDVSNPAEPFALSTFFTAVQANSVALQGNEAYVLDANTGFHVLDVSDPTGPFELGAFESPSGAAAIAINSHYVYLALNAPPTSITIAGPSLEVIDVADPIFPELLGSVAMPGPVLLQLPQPGDPSVQVTALAVSGGLALVGSALNGNSALGMVDVANPAAPQVVGRYDLPGTPQIAGIAIVGQFAFLADSSFGLRVLSLADPAHPVQIGSFAEPSTTISVSVQSNLCVLSGAFGADLLDVSQPSNPIRLGNNSISGSLNWLQAPLALGFGFDGIQVFDLVSFTNPLQIGQFAGSYGEVKVQGRYAFAAGDDAGLTVLDLGSAFGTPPAITAPPLDIRVVAGTTAGFFAGASGTVPLGYQWNFDGANLADDGRINGAQSEHLTLANVQPGDAGPYSVLVVNSLGSATSVVAQLSVDLPPSVSFVTPSHLQRFAPSATIPLLAQASDSDGSVAQVAFYNGSQLLAVLTSPPYSYNWSNSQAGDYTLTAIAMDNEGATNAAAVTVTVSTSPVFQLSAGSYNAYESNGLVTVTVFRNVTGSTAAVSLQTFSQSARAVNGSGIGNFYGVSTQLVFAANETAKDVPIELVNDLVYRGSLTFQVTLHDPDAGWTLTDPTNAVVTIRDDDLTAATNSFTDVKPAGPLDTNWGSLTINLSPAPADGRWRFPWEVLWRAGGTTASNLPPGNYPVVFLERSAWKAPAQVISVVTGGTNETETYTYASRDSGEPNGSLSIAFHPAAVTGSAQWRLAENPPGPWQNSGDVLSNIPPGLVIVEFKDVTNYTTPADRFLAVQSGPTTLYDVTYLLAPALTPGEGPRPLPNLATILSTNAPYQFSGQLLSDAGYSSGFVVKERTVLTAAHSLFDANTLSYSTNVWWFCEREAGEYEPLPQVPRGWYVFQGYAGARADDIASGLTGPNESTTPTRQQDVAALYFFEPAGRGGYGGYLTTEPAGTDWLLSGALKLLAGYPVGSVAIADRGRMHQVVPGYYYFTAIANTSLYLTTDLQSYPGNSGGPLCVLALDSLGRPFFLPAGVYLGGSGESVVRCIDIDVVDLINRADSSGHGGGNSTGGGVISISVLQGSGTGSAYLEVKLSPQAARSAGAAWRFHGESSFGHSSADETLAYPASSKIIEFAAIPGWEEPPSTSVSLLSGSTRVVNAVYLRPGVLGVLTTNNFTASGFAGGPFAPTNFTYTLTNSGEANLNWTNTRNADWVTVTPASGTLPGSSRTNVIVALSAAAYAKAVGIYTNILTFTNSSNGQGFTNRLLTLNVQIHPPVKWSAPVNTGNGSLSFTLSGITGRVYSIEAATNLSGAGWSEVRRVTNVTGQATVNLPITPSSRQLFYRAREL